MILVDRFGMHVHSRHQITNYYISVFGESGTCLGLHLGILGYFLFAWFLVLESGTWVWNSSLCDGSCPLFTEF